MTVKSRNSLEILDTDLKSAEVGLDSTIRVLNTIPANSRYKEGS